MCLVDRGVYKAYLVTDHISEILDVEKMWCWGRGGAVLRVQNVVTQNELQLVLFILNKEVIDGCKHEG